MSERLSTAEETPMRTDHAEPPENRFLAFMRSTLLTIGSVIGVFCIVLFAAALIFGFRTQVVISGSMEPSIPTGSLLVVGPIAASNIAVGDVVTVDRSVGGGLVTHRVIETTPVDEQVSLKLQGDANASPDPQEYLVDSAEKVLVTLPWVGYVALFLRTPLGIVALVAFGGALILAFFAGSPKKR